MNFEDFKYHESNVPSNFDKKIMYFENLKNTFYEEIKTTKNQHDYFKDFDTDSVESFMLHYASRKAQLAESYKYYINETYHNKELKYREETEIVFNLILQKKLWNIQLQWRAGQINIKEIRTSWDFGFWNQHITSCPFLPMVTESEIEIMKQYLNNPSYNYKSNSWIYNLQDYDELMMKDEEGDLSSMPEWYDYYDLHMGTSVLLLLPDLRRVKEEYYESSGRNYFHEESKKEAVVPSVYVSPPPHIFSSIEEMFKFAKAYEKDRHFIELFSIMNDLNKSEESFSDIDDYEIDSAIDLLKEAEIAIPITAHSDWREAIIQCSQQYMSSIIAKEIDVVYEEYKLFSEIGLSKNNDAEILQEFENDCILQLIKRFIFKGRELCGEPQDFDY